jgi:hypothetical protein
LASSLGACIPPTEVVRLDLPVARLEPGVAPVPARPDQPIVFVATPVQLAAFGGVERNAQGQLLPLNIRVPQAGVPTTHTIVAPSETPSLVGTDLYPQFNLRTIPLLPYGSFWVELGNSSDQPITIEPTQIHLVAGGKELKPLVDSGAQEGRFSRTIQAISQEAHRTGRPAFSNSAGDLHRALTRFEKPVTIPAHGSYKGFVLFDTNCLNADEYNAFLQKAGALTLELRDREKTLASVSFTATQKPLGSVCLPGTKAPSFALCEVLVPEAPISAQKQ